jgi:hypothetical protein
VPAEKVRLRIGNLAKAVLVTGQAYQDPKDALNEFVSNAADEYVEAGRTGGRIRIVLRRRGRHSLVAVDDDGRGMDVERLRQIARNLFESAKAGDDRTLGEKAIGILAFQQLGARCDIISRLEGEEHTHALRLVRGEAIATLEPNERRRPRAVPGTTVYISDLDPEVLRVLTQRKVVDYLRRRRAAALLRGEYVLEVIEGKSAEVVTPDRPDGVRLDLPPRATLWGRLEFNLYVAPQPDRPRRVAVVGRAGVAIVDDLCELEEFEGAPWDSDQVSGQIIFEALAQTAGRRAILRDREAFPVFIDAVTGIQPLVARTLERVAREVDGRTAERLSDVVRRIFGRVLKELADVDNPMRTPVGDEAGEGGLLDPEAAEASDPDVLELVPPAPPEDNGHADGAPPPPLEELEEQPLQPEVITPPPPAARPSGRRSQHLPSLAPDPTPGSARSRFDAEARVVLYNDRHPDYLLVKDEESPLLDYLATLVAKEYVVYNNPRASTDEVAEEMVRMLVRVRRHLPRRR